MNTSAREIQTAAASAYRRTITDRIIGYFSPAMEFRRRKVRANMAAAENWIGASKNRSSMKMWNSPADGPDGALINYELDTLRIRSRDLTRNSPAGGGAINRLCTNVVGGGLRVQSRLDNAILKMDDADVKAWESAAEREFRLWAEREDCDVERSMNFYELQALAFRAVLEGGDSLVIMPQIERGFPYKTVLQVIESERVSTPLNKAKDATITSGIEKDPSGAPVAYYISSQYPGSINAAGGGQKWERRPAFGEASGRRNVLHLYIKLRPSQTRGIPFLAPVIEPLRQLQQYTEAELMAAVISGMFTIFVETEGAEGLSSIPAPAGASTSTATSSTNELNLGYGEIVDLRPGEKVNIANPGRPNAVFDMFFQAILGQVAMSLEIPLEVLTLHYTSSYSAARAALLEAWRFFTVRRKWLQDKLCQPVYEAIIDEAVISGRLAAPGYFDNPLIRMAYLGTAWIGPARGTIDETKEVQAAEKRVSLGVSSLAAETEALTGNDWEVVHRQRALEHRMRVDAGLEEEPGGIKPPTAPGPDPDAVQFDMNGDPIR